LSDLGLELRADLGRNGGALADQFRRGEPGGDGLEDFLGGGVDVVVEVAVLAVLLEHLGNLIRHHAVAHGQAGGHRLQVGRAAFCLLDVGLLGAHVEDVEAFPRPEQRVALGLDALDVAADRDHAAVAGRHGVQGVEDSDGDDRDQCDDDELDETRGDGGHGAREQGVWVGGMLRGQIVGYV
jgi:hypothetical protein